jgi:prepilin-type N-terminal cleavage/methylation domain-containing protein
VSRGLTLVEVVVVLAIVGISAAVALPALGGLVAADPSPAAPLARLLDRSRRTAMERALPVTVTLLPATGRYWVWADSAETRAGLADGTLALGPGVRLAARDRRVRIRFDPAGRADGDSVAVWSAEGADLVTVDPWTGVVHVTAR